jgi:hypothetical protein
MFAHSRQDSETLKRVCFLEYHVLNMSMNTAAGVDQVALVYCVARLSHYEFYYQYLKGFCLTPGLA